MLVTLGQRRASDDVVELLLECHHRIRRFTAMAIELATRLDVPEAEVRTVAEQVRRYFAEALPLHMADEDLDLVPRLIGRDAAVDAALATMTQDHTDHAAAVERLIELCAALAAEPRRIATSRAALLELARELERELGAHLELEERIIFPALRARPSAEREAMRDAMRARRLS